MEKNQQFQVTITDYSSEGLGIGKTEGQFVWFIKDTVIGDEVIAAATKVKKHYGFARLVKLVTPSPARETPACPIARQCGGCQLQQMRYPAQLHFKQEKVYNNLLRIGEVPQALLDEVFQPIVGMESPFRYRNKAQYPIRRDKSGKIIAGFYAGRTHDVIACDDCLLGVEENKAILEAIVTWMEDYSIDPYDEKSGEGLVRHVLCRKGFRSGQHMVCLVINGTSLPHQEALVEKLCGHGGQTGAAAELRSVDSADTVENGENASDGRAAYVDRAAKDSGECPHVDSLSFSVNMENTNVIMGTKIVHLYGPGYIEDSIGEVRFRISPLSFYQVNPVQTEEMYGAALEFADLQGTENVWDLYCGIGTISLFLSQKAKQVYGVEIIPEAIEDARQNATLNGITNAEFYVGAAEEVLPAWYEAHPDECIDVVCVDPPRKGCDEKALNTIVQMAPEKLVYVSCDSATLARDVKYLRAAGYELRHVRPVDNFPETVHVETVALLTKKSDFGKKKRDFQIEMEVPISPDTHQEYKEQKPTYENIKKYIMEKHGVKVHTAYIAEVKRDCELDMRPNYNVSRKEAPVIKSCTPEKREYIMEALRYYKLVV